MALRILVISFLLFTTGCAGLLDKPLTPSQAGSLGVVSTAAATKIKEDLKEISTVKPVIHISPLEVCFKTNVLGPDKLQCILSPCKTNCSRVIPVSDVNFQAAVLIPENAWLDFSGEIKAACTSPLKEYEELCKMHYVNYDNTDALVIFGR